MSEWDKFKPIAKDEWERFKRTAPKASAADEVDMQRMADPKAEMSRTEKLLVGAGAAADRVARGITGLVAPGNDTKKYLEQGAEDAKVYQANHPGGWSTAGELGADIAMAATPVGAAGKALAATKALRTLGRAAPAAADIAANTAYAAATAPEDRGTAALFGAGATGASRAATKVLRGATPGPGAQHLIDSGIQPTFGQVVGETGGMIGQGVRRGETALEALPIVGGLVTKNRETARQQFRDVMKPEAREIPLRHPTTYTPKEMIETAIRSGEPVPHLARVAEDVMGSAHTRLNNRQTPIGGAALGALGMLAYKPALSILGSTAGYSLPATQRALTGQTTVQKKALEFLVQHPELANLGQQGLTQSMLQLVNPEN